MTKLSPEARVLVAAAGEAWLAHKVHRHRLEAELRTKMAAEVEEIERRSALKVAESLRRAIEVGATQSALREVTTRDYRTFRAFRDFDGLGKLP